MSPAVSLATPPLLFASPSSPSPPPPTSSMASQSPSQQAPAQPTAAPSTSVEMDLSTSLPSLPASAPPDHDMDSMMTDVEASSDGHVHDVDEMDGERSQPASDGMVLPASSSAAPYQPPPGGSPLPASLTSNATPIYNGQPQSQNQPLQNGVDAQPAQEDGPRAPAPPQAPDINGAPAAPGDPMDTTESGEFWNRAIRSFQAASEAMEAVAAAVSDAPQAARPEGAPVPSSQPVRRAPDPQTPGASTEHGESMDADDDSASDASSETDEQAPTRSDFLEDTSLPDEEELKEIESTTERLATDRECHEIDPDCPVVADAAEL